MDLVTYRIRHITEYRYEAPVSIAHNLAHLAPRDTDHQHAINNRLSIEPVPNHITRLRDYFGNWVHMFSLEEPHHVFRLSSNSRVTVQTPPERDLAASPAWETVLDHMQTSPEPAAVGALELTFGSPLVQWDNAIREYAQVSFPKGRPLLEGALDLTHRIYTEFAYQPGVTTITTPVHEVFAARTGVCQDFAHLQLACLRSLGLPARYVSGYLLTHPPPGVEKRVGADESHAWVAVYCPVHGYVDLDPTNDVIAGQEHTTVAWGRDFGDVTPLKGVVLGGGSHTVTVSVDVAPHAKGDLPLLAKTDTTPPSKGDPLQLKT